VIVHEIIKGTTEKIVFSVNSFQGAEYVHVRVYFEAGDGEWRPTKKGISVNAGLIDELYQGVSKLRDKVNERD